MTVLVLVQPVTPPEEMEFFVPNENEFFVVKCAVKGCVRGLRVAHRPEDHDPWLCPEHARDSTGARLAGAPTLAAPRLSP